MITCPLCHKTNANAAARCECGFRFSVPPDELPAWFDEMRTLLEWVDDYLRDLGFVVVETRSGFNGAGLELTRIAVLRR
jgi:hypothetical protein